VQLCCMKKLTYQRGSKQGKILDNAKADYKPFKLPENLQIENSKNEDRETLNLLHEICYQIWTAQKLEKIKKLENEESNFIHTSEYRRAS
jgi:hypothetical protein